MKAQQGGCLCGAVRYNVIEQPLRVTFCHCCICQRVNGSAYAVEPIFEKRHFAVTTGKPETYDHRSEGSGKIIHTHFCGTCGSNIYYSFERFPENVGIHAGGFDNPSWFNWSADNAKHIFLNSAQHGVVIPAGIPAFQEHAFTSDGDPVPPTIYDTPHMITRR